MPTRESSTGTSRSCRTTPGTSTARWARCSCSNGTERSSWSMPTRAAPCSCWTGPTERSRTPTGGNRVFNFVKGVDPKTGKVIDPWYPTEGKVHPWFCPWIAGAYSWNSGAYNPKAGLWYKIVQEGCMDLEIVRTTPITEPYAQLNIGANFNFKGTPDGPAYGHLDAREPVTGALKWS